MIKEPKHEIQFIIRAITNDGDWVNIWTKKIKVTKYRVTKLTAFKDGDLDQEIDLDENNH